MFFALIFVYSFIDVLYKTADRMSIIEHQLVKKLDTIYKIIKCAG